ncbi:UBX domain-containing protein 4-like [Mya arenaria]|uniref:UBX domain-containing protein 4-like n=1 Tax=Mya arenaria TaxID=6604 RepID=UPI0022E4EF68|nr:UBX domain-containing protein 4-like [Mya arenaria]
MKWFKGSIPEAIKLAKEKGFLFVVYVHGDDELSREMDLSWESEPVSTEVTGIVAIQINSSSDDCKHFSQIYPVVILPSTFCIGENGVPLEVIGGPLKPEDLVARIDQVKEMHTAQKQSLMAGENKPVTPGTSGAVGGEGQGDAGDQSTSSLPHEAKLERAKELIEKKRTEKEQKEFEKRREEEIKRRKLGQDLQKLKSTQQEMQMKELKDQMRKDKDDEKKARDRVKQQIARDREERNERFQKEKKEKEEAMESKKREKLLQQQAEAVADEARKSETARIQVRLPDGSSVTETFASSQPLRDLHNIVSQRLGGSVTLSQTYPKRRFTEEEMDQSFISLQLAPSAVLVAMPGGYISSQASSSSVQSAGIVSLVFSPLLFVWRFLCSLFYGGGSNSQPGESTNRPSQQSQPQNTRSNRPATAHQRRGNMSRMTDLRDDDDDMSTYNGNSTQQM